MMTPKSKKAARELAAEAFTAKCEVYCLNPGDGRPVSHAPICRTVLLRRTSDALDTALDEIDRLEHMLRDARELLDADLGSEAAERIKATLKESGNA